MEENLNQLRSPMSEGGEPESAKVTYVWGRRTWVLSIIISTIFVHVVLKKHDICLSIKNIWQKDGQGHRGRDHMVVGFTTTNAISAYHHWCYELEYRSGQRCTTLCDKVFSDLRQVSGGFLRIPPLIKLTATI